MSGANIGTLARIFSRAGGLNAKGARQAALIWLAALGRWPISTAERLALVGRLPTTGEMQPPVFILGHWRSGTTHLYNILAKADFGYVPPLATGLPWDLLGLARAFQPALERALPEHRYIDNIPVNPDSPQEDEIALANMTWISFYHGIYFPRHLKEFVDEGVFFDGLAPEEIAAWRETFLYFLRKLYLHQKRRQLIIKNPVYTARLKMLRETLPQAKFVHIHRNPYEVFASMRNFYKKLLAEFALQEYDLGMIDDLILETYERMMGALIEDARETPADAYVELRYEELDRDPLGVIETIYERLDIGDFTRDRPAFAAYLDTVKKFKKNKFSYTDEAAEKVESRWGAFLDRWGYARPGAETASA